MIADSLSQLYQPVNMEWSLHPEIEALIFELWGRLPTVDTFVTVHTSQLPQFKSPIPKLRALAVDALSHTWEGGSMYVFPLFFLLNKVCRKL